MTSDDKIDALRDEVAAYHVEVREHITKFESVEDILNVVYTDVYGVPGKRELHPGMLGDVATLKASRRWILIGLRGAWALMLVVGGALLAKVW